MSVSTNSYIINKFIENLNMGTEVDKISSLYSCQEGKMFLKPTKHVSVIEFCRTSAPDSISVHLWEQIGQIWTQLLTYKTLYEHNNKYRHINVQKDAHTFM